MKKSKTYSLKALRYGATNGFSTFLTTVASTYWAIFLTGAVGLPTAVMASILTVGSLADIISIPVVGIVMQKVKFKNGKFRPWLVVGGAGAALFRWLSFTDLGLTGMGMAVWFGGTYILTYLFFNFAFTAFTGILPMMASDQGERVAFSSARVLMNSIGKFIFSLTSVGLITVFSGGGDPTSFGYSIFVLLCCVLVAFGFIQLYFGSKDYDTMEPVKTDAATAKKNDANFFEMIKYAISVPYLLYLVAAVGKACVYFSIMGVAAYYYMYVAGDMGGLTIFLTLNTFLMILGAAVTPIVSKLFKGIKNAYIFGVAWFGACLGLAYFIGNSVGSFTALLAAGYFGYSIAHSGETALFTRVVDYNQLRTDKDIRAFSMSMFSLTPKIGTTVGAAVLGFGLVAVGFDAENVTPEAIQGIRVLISALPAAFAAISALALVFFPLNDKKAAENSEKLEARKVQAEAKEETV